MSLANRLYPRADQARRRRHFRALQTALIVGLVVSGLLGLLLYMLASRPRH